MSGAAVGSVTGDPFVAGRACLSAPAKWWEDRRLRDPGAAADHRVCPAKRKRPAVPDRHGGLARHGCARCGATELVRSNAQGAEPSRQFLGTDPDCLSRGQSLVRAAHHPFVGAGACPARRPTADREHGGHKRSSCGGLPSPTGTAGGASPRPHEDGPRCPYESILSHGRFRLRHLRQLNALP